MTGENGHGHRGGERHLSYERAVTAAAASAAERSPAPITSLAEQRAPLEPVRDFLLRDLPMDGLEEGADWRNYLCWQLKRLDLQQRTDPAAVAARAAMMAALSAVIEAFAQQDLARRLLALESDPPSA